MATYEEAIGAEPSAPLKNAALLLLKFAVTAACFWYVVRQVNLADFARLLGTFNYGWAALAVLLVMLETPMVALRWGAILNGLGSEDERTPAAPIVSPAVIPATAQRSGAAGGRA